MRLDKKVDKLGASALTKHSKAYWRERVFQPVISGVQIDNYAVRMSCENRQRSLSLRTQNREQAAQTAKDWYAYLSTYGWAAFDAKYRSPTTTSGITIAPGDV